MNPRIVSLVLAFTLILAATGARAQTLPDLNDYFESITSTQDQTSGTTASVDLLFESNSYVPPFYRGRPLPSPGSLMRFHAVPHFVNAAGSTIPDSQMEYTWRRDGQVEGAVSGVGESSVTLLSPTLFGTDTISVEARAIDGSVHGSASLTISAVDPGVTLYLDHPLYGIEYYDALGSQTSISDVEMTFAAVPYFVPLAGLSDMRLSYAWRVNNIPVAATTTNGSEIIINAQHSSGFATLSLLLTSPANALLNAQNSWNILFSRGTFALPRSTAQ